MERHHAAMLAAYGRADERFCWGQLVVFDEDAYRAAGNWTSARWRGPISGRVWGFSRRYPWCMIVLLDGVRYPHSYSHTFWRPR